MVHSKADLMLSLMNLNSCWSDAKIIGFGMNFAKDIKYWLITISRPLSDHCVVLCFLRQTLNSTYFRCLINLAMMKTFIFCYNTIGQEYCTPIIHGKSSSLCCDPSRSSHHEGRFKSTMLTLEKKAFWWPNYDISPLEDLELQTTCRWKCFVVVYA